MDKWTFAIELIKALIWPLFLLGIVLIFRRPLTELIARLKKASVGNVAFDFAKGLEEAKAISVEAEKGKSKRGVGVEETSQDRYIRTGDGGHGTDSAVGLSRSELGQDFLQFVKCADRSPREAILKSWQHLESAAVKTAERHGLLEGTKSRNPSMIGKALDNAEILGENDLRLFDRLRYLRNKVVHVEDFKPQTDEALEYAGLALQLARYLRDK